MQMTQMPVLNTWISLMVLAGLVFYSSAQLPCQKRNCPSNTYCSETANGSTVCISCDVSCVGCYGPGPEMCSQCKIGYIKHPGEIQPCMPCPDGFYGVNCSSSCHCLNNQQCNKTDGFCMGWKCDRGYTGLPYCQQLCPAGTFGLDCLFLCHCPENDNCSNVNGDCSSSQCHPEWTSSGCQRRLPKLTHPPQLFAAECGNITLQWNAFNETRDIGNGPVGQYNIYLMLNHSNNASTQPWQLVGNSVQQPDKVRYTYSVTQGLLPDEEYNFRVDVVGVENDKLLSKISQGIESDIIVNPCTEITTPTPENTTLLAISRKVFDQVNITALNSTYVMVTWVILPEFKGYEYNITISIQLLGNGDCDSEEGPLNVTEAEQHSSGSFVFSDLGNWSTYRISVSAIAITAELRETFSQNVTTLPSAPLGVITDFSLESITSSEAVLKWKPVPCNESKGAVSSYDVQVTTAEDSAAPVGYSTKDTRFRVTDLSPYTNYSVRIRFLNMAGAGPWSEEYNFTTLEGVPGPVEIIELNPTYSTITVTFTPPAVTNGIITTYTTMFVSNISDFNMSQSIAAPATNGRINMTVDRLSPETLYYLKIAASTSAGIGQYGSVKQATTLKTPPPPDPMTMKLLSQTTTCLTIEWTPPANIVDSLSYFMLEVRSATADFTTPPVRVNIPVANRSHQICDLKPSSLYFVTISGINTDGIISSVTDNFSTAHGTPPTPAAPIFVRSTYTSITIEIEPVVSLDVPITAYQIQAYLVPSASKSKRYAGVPGYVTAELSSSDITKSMEFVVGDGHSTINKALERESYYMIYYVAISTLNNDTTASWSQIKAAVLTVPFDAALAPPVAIILANKNTTCLQFTWKIPEEMENSTTGFTLNVSRTYDDTAPILTRDLPATTRNHQQCNLTPYTPYTIRITAKTSSGMLTVASETFITEHSAPDKPAAPVFVNATFTTITVSIDPVILTGGPLTAYQLKVEEVSSSRRKRVAGVPGYVTAQLTQQNVARTMNFIIGNGLKYENFTNIPLKRETWYIIHYVVISTADGMSKCNYSSLSPSVKTVPFVGNKDDIGVYIGVIVALVLFILLVLLLIFLYWWWRRRKERYNPYEIQENEKNAIPVCESKDNYEPEDYWSIAHNLKDSRYIIGGKHLVYREDQDPFVNVDTATHPAQPRISFSDEFDNLPLPDTSTKSANNLARKNRDLNRFPHLMPYDHSLVKLKPDASSRRTYINASFISGYKKGQTYIAAQSPYDDKTIVDFWRLIFQKSIKTVVMIANGMEDKHATFCRYWPETTKESCGHFLLHLIEAVEFSDFTVRTVAVKSPDEEYSKTVKLFHFTSWPTHGVPDDPIPFLEMRYKARRYHHDGPGPILVHCDTGMDKTGVFIAVDALIEQYSIEGKVRVFNFVRSMRKDRPCMVRTREQYVFIYEAIFEEFHAGDTLVDFDLKERYQNWAKKNVQTGHTYLKDQFHLLEAFSRGPSADDFKTAQLEMNMQKNRYQNILPPEKYRPILKSQGGLNPTDYINALFLDSYFRKNKFIITQTPLHTTIIDFWKLVYDYDVRTIVMVENFENEDNTCAEYWPSMNLKLFEPFFIETTAVYQHDSITIRNFSIRSTQYPKKPPRLVRQFQFTAWAQQNLTPPSRTVLLDLIDGMFVWQDETCQDEKPVIIHCQDGVSHSGLFAILAILCEKMEEEGEVDVYRTIKHCKRRRTQFISDYDQFRYCYKTLWDFINMRMPGGTFTDTFQKTDDQQLNMAATASLSSFDRSSDEGTTEI